MDDLDPITYRHAIQYQCSACTRRFVAFGQSPDGPILCSCGAPLSQRDFPRGLYELQSPVCNDDERATDPTPSATPTPMEPDVGYGASHGYGPSHGGPTGPGDAPASVSEDARS